MRSLLRAMETAAEHGEDPKPDHCARPVSPADAEKSAASGRNVTFRGEFERRGPYLQRSKVI
jgi:hypothetical protein